MDDSKVARVYPRSPGAHTVAALTAELKLLVRRETQLGRSELEWSLPIADLGDSELDEVLAAMARAGCRGRWEREYAFAAHFSLSW